MLTYLRTESHCARGCRPHPLSRYVCRFSEITVPQTRADQSEPPAETPLGPGWAEAAKETTCRESSARRCITSWPFSKENSGSGGESLGPGTFPGWSPGGWPYPWAVPAPSLRSTHQAAGRVSPSALESWGALVGRGGELPRHLSPRSPSPAQVGTLGSVQVSALPEPTQAWESGAPRVSRTGVNSESPLASSNSASCCSAGIANAMDHLRTPAAGNAAAPEQVKPPNLEARQSAARLCHVSGLFAPLCTPPPRRSQSHPPAHSPEPRGSSVTQVKPPLDRG